MDNNIILGTVLAGGKSQRFGEDKSKVKLNGTLLIDYILSQIIDEFKEILVVSNNKIQFKITRQQKFIEYSPQSTEYLKIINKKIERNNGGILIIDYAYIEKNMKNTLQAVSKHKYCGVLEGFGNSDITYNLSFNLINRIVKEFSSLTSVNTTQGEFLTKLGILERVEILSRKMLFSKKADLYFRVKRLIDKNQMGKLFKVMLITTNKNKFKLGF